MADKVVTFDASVDKGSFDSSNPGSDQVMKDRVVVLISKGAMNLTDQYRCYKNETLTIRSLDGNIKKAVITCTAVGDAQYGPGNFTNPTAGTYTFADKVGTWEGDSPSFGLTASGAQVRITNIVVTIADNGSTTTKTTTTIEFSEGYKTQIAKGPDGMFPEIGSSVALPTATVKAGDAAVAGANVEWSIEVKSWKAKKEGEQPVLADGKISFEGHGVVLVKASYAGNDTYEASTKSYTLTVHNSYGLLSELVKDIVDPKFEKNDVEDKDGYPVFYFFRNIDADGFPPVTSTVTYANGKYIYLTDGEGNNLLFYGTNSQDLKQGDKISGNIGEANLGGFWGMLKRYNKLPEFAFTDMNVKVESSGNAVTPTTITVNQMGDNINNYVKIEDAEFVSANNKNLSFKVGDKELAVYNQFNVQVNALEATAKYTLEGMGCVYKKNAETDAVYQLYLISFTKTADPSGINVVKANQQNGAIYNVAGQKVSSSYKGLVIVNGKKMIQK